VKSSVPVLACLVVGTGCGALGLPPKLSLSLDPTLAALYVLLFLIGVEIGGNTEVWQKARDLRARILLVPLAVVIGTLLGVGLLSLPLQGISLRHALAVGAGFGYYSLASVLTAQLAGKSLGVLALLVNLLREMATLVLAPLLVRCFGKLAPIASGGATAMDTTLPVISRSAGAEYALVAVFSGVILTLLVPLLITFLLAG
jgi:uncharacterized membrane protein YbjE (DUF340 family)